MSYRSTPVGYLGAEAEGGGAEFGSREEAAAAIEQRFEEQRKKWLTLTVVTGAGAFLLGIAVGGGVGVAAGRATR